MSSITRNDECELSQPTPHTRRGKKRKYSQLKQSDSVCSGKETEEPSPPPLRRSGRISSPKKLSEIASSTRPLSPSPPTSPIKRKKSDPMSDPPCPLSPTNSETKQQQQQHQHQSTSPGCSTSPTSPIRPVSPSPPTSPVKRKKSDPMPDPPCPLSPSNSETKQQQQPTPPGCSTSPTSPIRPVSPSPPTSPVKRKKSDPMPDPPCPLSPTNSETKQHQPTSPGYSTPPTSPTKHSMCLRNSPKSPPTTPHKANDAPEVFKTPRKRYNIPTFPPKRPKLEFVQPDMTNFTSLSELFDYDVSPRRLPRPPPVYIMPTLKLSSPSKCRETAMLNELACTEEVSLINNN